MFSIGSALLLFLPAYVCACNKSDVHVATTCAAALNEGNTMCLYSRIWVINWVFSPLFSVLLFRAWRCALFSISAVTLWQRRVTWVDPQCLFKHQRKSLLIHLHLKCVHSLLKMQGCIHAKLHLVLWWTYWSSSREAKRNLKAGGNVNKQAVLCHAWHIYWPLQIYESGAEVFLFIEPPIIENNSSTSLIQPFALSMFWQSGETLCGEVLEGGASGRLHQAAV